MIKTQTGLLISLEPQFSHPTNGKVKKQIVQLLKFYNSEIAIFGSWHRISSKREVLIISTAVMICYGTKESDRTQRRKLRWLRPVTFKSILSWALKKYLFGEAARKNDIYATGNAGSRQKVKLIVWLRSCRHNGERITPGAELASCLVMRKSSLRRNSLLQVSTCREDAQRISLGSLARGDE